MRHVQRARNGNKVLDRILVCRFQTSSSVRFHNAAEVFHELFDVLSNLATVNDNGMWSSLDFFGLIPVLLWLTSL